MRIAIIDDGIGEGAVSADVERYCVRDGKIEKSGSEGLIPLSHAGHCAMIIEKYCKNKDELSFIDIRILYDDDKGNPEDMIAALEFCHKMNIRLINLSCGFDSGSKESQLSLVCKKLYDEGVTVIAANNNSCCLTYPACLPTVISVEEELSDPRYALLWYVVADVSAHGEHRLMFGEKEIYSRSGNSYACAYVTGLAANQLSETGTFNLNKLNKTVRVPSYCKIYDFALLPDAVLLSDECDSKDISFDYIKYPGKVYPKAVNLVVIPSKTITNRSAMEALNKLSGSVLSLYWCGEKIPRTLKKSCERKGVRYWDESIDCSQLPQIQPEAPMISFFGERNTVEKTMFSIKSLLLNDGYNPLLVSDRERAYLYGFKKMYDTNSVSVYAYHFMPDIILIESKDKTTDADDINVECCSDGFKINNNALTAAAESLEQLYNTIKNIYGG